MALGLGLALYGGTLSLAGCVTPDGCNAFASGDECMPGEYRCSGERGIQRCLEIPCGNRWETDSCEAARPYCVRVGNVRAECSATSHCDVTQACTSSGICGDGADGCVPTADGCARTCVYGRCGFDGLRCVPTQEGCANDPICKSKGQCNSGAETCSASAEGCVQSDRCKAFGYCEQRGSGCGLTADVVRTRTSAALRVVAASRVKESASPLQKAAPPAKTVRTPADATQPGTDVKRPPQVAQSPKGASNAAFVA